MPDLPDSFLDCGCISPGSLYVPDRHWCGKPNPEAPRLNDCGFIGTYEEHRAMGCCPGPKLNPLAVLQRAARRAEGERDTVELTDYVDDPYPFGRCDRCLRPLPHSPAELAVCPQAAAGSGVSS